MATFRKSASKTRAALEGSTALPQTAPDILDHAGEQVVRMTNPAKSAKSARKTGSATPPLMMPDAEEVTVGMTHAAELATDMGFDAALTAASRAIEQPVAAPAETLTSTIQSVTEVGGEAVVAKTAAPSTEATHAEAESVMADIAGQVSNASADILPTTTDLTAQSLADTADDAQDLTSAVADAAVSAPEEAAAPIGRVSTGGSEAGSAQALGEFNARLADLFRDYFEDSFAFFAAMSAVRSVPEALTVNQQHFQRRLDAITAHSRDLTLLAGKVAAQTMIPFTPAAFR